MASRVVHRVAVAFGWGANVPPESKDYGSGFIHVFDDPTLQVPLRELDTISDFVEYVAAREELLTSGLSGILIGSEKGLLAAYFVGTQLFGRLRAGDYHYRGLADRGTTLPL